MIEFIMMLTRQDRTIEDCLDCLDLVQATGVRHIGFKDVGADVGTLRELCRQIEEAGAVSYLEVVSTSKEANLASAQIAMDIEVDRLLGGTEVEATLEVLGDSKIEYFPFVGRPFGHPTSLAGTPEEVAEDCRRCSKLGCAGVDLLAYRSTDADPVALMKAARAATDGELIIAGGVDSPARINEIVGTGADAFTVGSAIFDGSFSGRKGLITSQIEDILAACV